MPQYTFAARRIIETLDKRDGSMVRKASPTPITYAVRAEDGYDALRQFARLESELVIEPVDFRDLSVQLGFEYESETFSEAVRLQVFPPGREPFLSLPSPRERSERHSEPVLVA